MVSSMAVLLACSCNMTDTCCAALLNCTQARSCTGYMEGVAVQAKAVTWLPLPLWLTYGDTTGIAMLAAAIAV